MHALVKGALLVGGLAALGVLLEPRARGPAPASPSASRALRALCPGRAIPLRADPDDADERCVPLPEPRPAVSAAPSALPRR